MTDDFKTLAAQLRDLQDATKAQIAGVMARAEEAGLDPAGLRRFVSWKRKDEAKRAQQEAIDQQCRYLAGERETPAQLPVGCELSQALNLYRRGLTVRQVAEELRVSTGKAGKLKQLSRMFTVHVHETVDKMPDHDPDTGEITKTADLRNTPAGDGIEALTPDGQDAVAGNPIEDAAGRSPGDEGEESADNNRDHDYSGRRDALRRDTDGGGDGAGPCPAQVQSDRQPDCRRDQGPVRGNHSADAQPSGRFGGDRPAEAGGIDRNHTMRGAADAGGEGELRPGVGDAGRGVAPSSTPHVSARPDPYEEAPPPFLDQRHKARARATG